MSDITNITLEFGQGVTDYVGRVELNDTANALPLNEYVIAPASYWDDQSKSFVVTGWGLVHRSHVHAGYAKAMAEREQAAKS